MARSERTKEENKMTIYFDKRAEEAQDAEAAEEKQKEDAIKAAAGCVSLFAKPLILMLLWNWLMPGLFGLATINYLKAFALWMIARLIFDKE